MIKWFLRLVLVSGLGFALMVAAIGARPPYAVILLFSAKGCWIIFLVCWFRSLDNRRKRNKRFR